MDTKNFLTSKTIWGLAITLLFAVLDTMGISIGITEPEAVDLVNKIGEVVGLVIAAIGRFTAKKSLTVA